MQKSKIKNIGIIIKLLKKESKKFINPIVTEIGEETRSPYMVLVSCLLSLRTQDKTTGPVAKKLFDIAKTPEAIAKMPLKKIQKIIRPVNYYITKSKRIKEISKTIISKYNGEVPDTFEELMKFKGVGRKTANIVMTYGFFKKDYIAVDTHVNRIPNRLGWIKTKTPEQTEEELKKISNQLVSKEELERTQNYLAGTYELELQKNSTLAQSYSFNELYGLGFEEVHRYPEKILQVTREDVLKVAKKYIDLKAYVLSIVQPK